MKFLLAATLALGCGSCSLLFSSGDGQPASDANPSDPGDGNAQDVDAADGQVGGLPVPELHYALSTLPDLFAGDVPNTGSAASGPVLRVEDGQFANGRLLCSGTTDKCAQTLPSDLFGSCIDTSTMTFMVVLNTLSDAATDVAVDVEPHEEIVRITEASTLDHVMRLGIDLTSGGALSPFAYQGLLQADGGTEKLVYETVTPPEQPTEKHHMAFVLDGTRALYFVDGQPQVQVNDMPRLAKNDTSWRLKLGSDSRSQDWTGEVFDLSFYCRVLSEVEVQAIYEASP